MAPRETRRAVLERSFIPFRLYLSDGSNFDVISELDASVELLCVSVGTDPDRDSGLFRKSIRISPNHVTQTEAMPELRAS